MTICGKYIFDCVLVVNRVIRKQTTNSKLYDIYTDFDTLNEIIGIYVYIAKIYMHVYTYLCNTMYNIRSRVSNTMYTHTYRRRR